MAESTPPPPEEAAVETRPSAAKGLIYWIGLLSLAYAVVRYHGFGGVPWTDFPMFILNKAISLTAFLLLTLNFALGPLHNLTGRVPASWLNARKALGMTGFLLAFVHLVMSLMLFGPANYARFFEDSGKLSLIGGLSMVTGIVSWVILWAYNASFQTFLREDRAFIAFITSRGFMMTALLLGAAHLFFMGYAGWMEPSGWHGGLPPISLVAFTAFVIGYVINLFGRE